MKFTCTQENFFQGLSAVSRVASKSAVLAILNNVLIIAEEGVVQLQTTNLELAITVNIRAKIDEPGRYTVPSRLLTEFVSLLGNEKVSINTDPTGLVVTSGHSQTTIKGTSPEEFPVLPSHDAPTVIQVPATALKQALEGTIFAAASDESRPEISGILFSINKKELVIAATDSYRLAERKITALDEVADERQTIIPSRTAQEVLRLTPENDSIITIKIGDDQARFNLPQAEIISRVIEGQYPDYRQIIPGAWRTKIDCDREEIISNIRATSLFCKTGINDLNLAVDKDLKNFKLSAANTQIGEHQSVVMADIEGEQTDIVFNYRYLLDGVQSLGGDNTIIELQDHNSPGVLRNPKNPSALYLLMPIRQ